MTQPDITYRRIGEFTRLYPGTLKGRKLLKLSECGKALQISASHEKEAVRRMRSSGYVVKEFDGSVDIFREDNTTVRETE